jgi:hypothetical protein
MKYQASPARKIHCRLAQGNLKFKKLFRILILIVVPLSIAVHFALNIFRKLSSTFLAIIALILVLNSVKD